MGHHIAPHRVVRFRLGWKGDEYCIMFGHQIKKYGDGPQCQNCDLNLDQCLESGIRVEMIGEVWGFDKDNQHYRRQFRQKYRLDQPIGELLGSLCGKVNMLVIHEGYIYFNSIDFND